MKEADEKLKEMHMGRIIHMLSHQMKRNCNNVDSAITNDDLTVMQKHVLKFVLLESLHRDLYQKDIEEEFQIRKSTVTGILKLMESHGYIRRESVKRDARLKRIDTERIRRELDARRIVIVTGFQGVDKYDDYTTLGRGGSDTTAVALAAALHADACEIYTDVDGVYTADPRKVPNARKLKEITYDEMLDLATSGAGVLHNRSVEMAKKYGVPLVVRSSLNNSEGTVVKEVVTVERMLISGVALDTDAVRIAVLGLRDVPGVAFKVFDTLARKNINVDVILQSIGRAGTKDISFTVNRDDLDDAVAALEENQERLGFKELHSERNIAKLSIVGSGMLSNPGVAAKMFESLYNEGVNINMISTSEIRITVLINEKDGIRAMNAVHDAFGLAD